MVIFLSVLYSHHPSIDVVAGYIQGIYDTVLEYEEA
jgi:hypothetical protein